MSGVPPTTLAKTLIYLADGAPIAVLVRGDREVNEIKVKKLLGKAKPDKRAAHVRELLQLFAQVCAGEIILIYVDEVHVHRDLDLGYTWGRRGERLWRRSDCPKLQDRMNAYGAYDFTHGECLLWQDAEQRPQRHVLTRLCSLTARRAAVAIARRRCRAAPLRCARK